MTRYLLNLLIFASLCPLVASADFKLIGIDEAGVEKISQVSQTEYKTIMREVLKESHIIANEQKNIKINRFRLKRVSIGIGAEGDIGIGPYRAGGSIQQKFYFERELR